MTKYLKLFTNYSETDSYESGTDYIEPYVSLTEVIGGGDVRYNLVPSIILTMNDSIKIKLYNETAVNVNTLSNTRPDIDISNITNIELSNKITSIDSLLGCRKLESINIPDSVKTIKMEAFNNCQHLYSIVIPKSINKLSSETFRDCISLTSVTLTDSLQLINDKAFMGDENIRELKIIGKKQIINLLPYELITNLTHLYVDESLVNFYEGIRDAMGKTFEISPLN